MTANVQYMISANYENENLYLTKTKKKKTMEKEIDLNELQKIIFKFKRLSDKINVRRTELENIDHDWGENETEKLNLIDKWAIEKNNVRKTLRLFLNDNVLF